MRFDRRWRRTAALLLAASVFASSCATAGGRLDGVAASAAGHPAIADFVQKLPLGTQVQIDRRQGRSVRGTLLKATAASVTVQPRTRIPEPPVDIAMTEIVRVQPETANGRSVGKAVGIGAAAGGGAALGVLLILLAIFAD